MTFKHIVIDGPDGTGKTTQINLLKDFFEFHGSEVILTRGIGGQIGSETEIIRKLLSTHKLQDKYLEELLFSISEEANLKSLLTLYYKSHSQSNLVVLQDRGLASHFAYALVKECLSLEDVRRIYSRCLDDFEKLDTFNIVLVPESASVVVDRIKKRNEKQSKLDKQYENIEFQSKIINKIKELPQIETKQRFFDNEYWFNYLTVSADVAKDDVHKMILQLVRKRYGFVL